MAAMLLTHGAKVSAINSNGDRPLHAATLHASVVYGHMAVVELLIAEGARVNARNNDGHRPLRLAADKYHKDMVELLKRHGAKE